MVESPGNRSALEDSSYDASHSIPNHKDKETINSFSERFMREDAEVK